MAVVTLRRWLPALAFLSATGRAMAAPPGVGAAVGDNPTAIALSGFFVLATLAITVWATRRLRGPADFYAAGGNVGAMENGLAITGDTISGAIFLGLAALVYSDGFDGLITAASVLIGWPLILFLVAERLRNLGQYTLGDVLSVRLRPGALRSLAAGTTLAITACYLVAQLVGAGRLIALLFPDLGYSPAVLLVGALVLLCVALGGMLAATWVQILKGMLLLGGASAVAFLVLTEFGFDANALFAAATAAHPRHDAIMAPAGIAADPVSALSIGLSLVFGTIGLPHLLIRFFSVRNVREARKSAFWATSFVGYFCGLSVIIGFGAIALVQSDPHSLAVPGVLPAGNALAALRLADAVGGPMLLGVIAAGAAVAVLGVASGLLLAGASALGHDLYAGLFARLRPIGLHEIGVTRAGAVVLGVAAIVLSLALPGIDVALLVELAFALAASASFPVLLLAMHWRGLTTRGALLGGGAGLAAAVVLTILGPAVWVRLLGFAQPVFPWASPTLLSMPLGFAGCWIGSALDRSEAGIAESMAFDSQYIRAQTGIGAEGVQAG